MFLFLIWPISIGFWGHNFLVKQGKILNFPKIWKVAVVYGVICFFKLFWRFFGQNLPNKCTSKLKSLMKTIFFPKELYHGIFFPFQSECFSKLCFYTSGDIEYKRKNCSFPIDFLLLLKMINFSVSRSIVVRFLP